MLISRYSQVHALLLGTHDALAVRVTAQARDVTLADIVRAFVHSVRAQLAMALHALSHLVASPRCPLILIVASVTNLRILATLGSLQYLSRMLVSVARLGTE